MSGLCKIFSMVAGNKLSIRVKNTNQKKKGPLSSTPLLEHLFQMVGTDLCELKGRLYCWIISLDA